MIAALEDSLSDRIDSFTSYSLSRSAFIQVGAFRKFKCVFYIADDISNRLGTTVEVLPLVSEPVISILFGSEHKDENFIDVIADLMV